MKGRLVAIGIVTLAAGLTDRIFTPIASLAANATIVNQLDHSNAASLANTAVGNGEWIPHTVILIAWFAAVSIILYIGKKK
jgi:hypothetical protein